MLCDDPVLEPVIQLRPRKAKKRVLIVDDEREQTEVLAYRLEKCDFEILVAHNGRDALRIAREANVDLIFLDLGLPDLDGLEVCAQLNDDPQTCEVPVIIVSASEDAQVVRAARTSGSRYFLRKPYDPNVLLLLAESALHETSCDES